MLLSPPGQAAAALNFPDDEENKSTNEQETAEQMFHSPIALNIRFTDKTMPQNYRNSLFNKRSAVDDATADGVYLVSMSAEKYTS